MLDIMGGKFDLGNPNIKKRLYKVIVNYENSDQNSNGVTMTATFGCDEYCERLHEFPH